jgi:hypothetical protein
VSRCTGRVCKAIRSVASSIDEINRDGHPPEVLGRHSTGHSAVIASRVADDLSASTSLRIAPQDGDWCQSIARLLFDLWIVVVVATAIEKGRCGGRRPPFSLFARHG